jgi:predicted nucleotidyltransferase
MTKYGLESEDIEKINNVLRQYTEVEKAILYGSRAKGNYRPYSDIDLTLTGIDLTPQLYRIIDKIDDLLLPYTFDISILSDISNPGLIDHINRVGQVFYERG